MDSKSAGVVPAAFGGVPFSRGVFASDGPPPPYDRPPEALLLAPFLMSWFEHLAALEPERLAAQDEVSAVTYGELNVRANQFARVLIDQRLIDHPLVAVFCEHGIGMIVAALAATKAGLGVTFPETTDPDEKVGPLLAQAGCAIVVTDTANLSRARTLTHAKCPVIDVDSQPNAGFADNLGRTPPMDAVAFIRYTSGSTGSPKGAIYTFDTLRHALARSITEFEIRRDDRIVIFESFGITVTYAALSVGASIHLFALRRRGAAELASWLNRRSISLCAASPTVLRQCVGDAPERIKTVRKIVLVGEPVFRSDAALMERHFPDGCVLSVVYGMTECPVAATFRYSQGAAFEGELLPSGWASPGIEIHILDDEGRRLPPGETGEVALVSDGVTHGYWQQPSLTAQVFLPDSDGGTRRLYLTRDLGRIGADGCLWVTGRKDDEIKVRNRRVVLSDVEEALRGDDVVLAAVTTFTNALGAARLAAYVVPRGSIPFDGAAIRDRLRQRLPDYMVPSVILPIDALPMTPTGKVDRRSLPAPRRVQRDDPATFVEPGTPMETKLVEVWEELLVD